MKLKASAKLNLFLEVTGKRANGYHELYSLCAFLDLTDEIEIVESPTVSFSGLTRESSLLIDPRVKPEDDIYKNNIVLKAANKLKEKYAVNKGCDITLTKNIPVGGGLGGGSADAATTLIGLNELWKLNLAHDELYKIGLELGADVPVCLYSQLNNANAAFFSGIGETLSPAPQLPKIYFVLINPNIHLATKEVFQKVSGFREYKKFDYLNFLESLKTRTNDLEPASKALCPEIDTILKTLLHQNGCIVSRMSGSGSTCFGIFTEKEKAELAAKKISQLHPKWFVKTANLI